jgi:hypothetical protein
MALMSPIPDYEKSFNPEIPERQLERKDSGDFELVIDLNDPERKYDESKDKRKKDAFDPAKHLELEKRLVASLALAKSLFKPDTPYRTRLSSGGLFNTNGSGILAAQFAVSNLSTTANWSALLQLFDQFFVHSMTFRYFPYNTHGHPTGGSTTAGAVVSTTAATPVTNSNGIVGVCLFGILSFYSSWGVMLNNATRKFFHSGNSWNYVWRNNVRFDPRGLQLSTDASMGWTGWTQIAEVADYGGGVQFRANNDTAFGDGAHTLNIGTYVVDYDVSFRVRS